MVKRTSARACAAALLLLVGYAAGRTSAATAEAQASQTRVFEMRTYTAPDAEKFAMLQARFRDHTTKIFQRVGMTNIGYWTPVDTPNTLVYILAFPSMEDAKKSWAAFRSDPEWQSVSAKTKEAGLTGIKVESKYLQPTDYSPIK